MKATANAKDTIAYGTRIVGGISPGKGGSTHLDLPVFNTVEEVSTPPTSVAPLGYRVLMPFAGHENGPTSSPEQCRVGIMPYKQYQRGCIGIVSKSGTLSYEAVGATTAVGLGQSIVLGMGGDLLPGTTLADGLRLFFEDEETKGIIVIGEIGGEAELRAAELIREYRQSTPRPKPIVAMVAGKTAPLGRIMGHAGAVLTPRDVPADIKAKALEDAGAVVVPHPGVMGVTMKRLLEVDVKKELSD
ncbi:hypothetical protein THAR02_05039 [Trichoderma harzianum]|uniref:ATP-citrate lyase/succinyl-CoA ligase domain-containing protein n=1 Tax=Trichoderma harzianum TaxID=5544 RepID=A0A0F9XRN9_TRIHA|nr:hypothetical protein THAR02_05039 [Trichoderma harzianum]